MRKEDRIFCNCCGKEIPADMGGRMEDYFHMEKTWGYFSRKDGMTQAADVCEECMDSWIRGFRIAPEEMERTELFEC